MLKSTQTSSGLLWFCYKVLVQAPWHCSLQETHQLWQIAMTWVPTGTKWPRGCHQNPSIRTFGWDHIFPNISWDKVKTFALQTLSFTTCLSATLLTGYIQLTILTQDTDTKHSQDVGRLKSLHGVDFFVENGLHLSANGKKNPLWWQWIHTDVNTRKQYSNVWAQI